MKISHVRAIDLTNEEIARCRELSFGDEGYMCEDLDYILDHERGWQYRYSQTVLLRDNGILVGWALLQPIPYKRRYSLHLFVDPAHRRKGYGAKLLTEANKWGKAPAAMVDQENSEFFTKFPDLYIELENV